MKKSKIIIPALGMLLLSTAASVTGTVAWFTSMQTGSAAIDSFAVTKTGGSLTTELVAENGTELNSDSSAVVLKGTVSTAADATDDAILTHGSYDHTSDSIWKPNDSLDVFTQVARPTSGTGYQWTVDGTSSAAGKIYYAVSWKINFTYTYSSDTRDVYLFFDGSAGTGASSSFSHSKADSSDTGTYSKYTYMGFRIAMVNSGTNGAKVIWAPGTSTAADEVYHNGAARTSQGVYPGTGSGTATSPNTYNASGSIIDATGLANVKTGDLPSNPTQRADYIGTFTNATPGTTNKITVNCIAWFEGNDQNVVDAAELDKVSASLGFYTRIKPAA